jgi:hypothetical protein
MPKREKAPLVLPSRARQSLVVPKQLEVLTPVNLSLTEMTLVSRAFRSCARGQGRMLQNGQRFGRDLADRMAVRMQFQRVTVEQVTLNAAADVAKLANEMISAGMTRENAAVWIEQVQIGYVERLREQASSAGPLHRAA